MRSHDMSKFENSSCKLKCKERESKVDTLHLFICAMKNQTLICHVTAQCVYVGILIDYMVG